MSPGGMASLRGVTAFRAGRACVTARIWRLLRASVSASVLGLAAAAAPAATLDFGPCDVATSAPDAIAAALDDILALAVSPPETGAAAIGAAPGAVLSVRTPGWSYVRSLGSRDPETDAPLDCATPFEIGSNTKMMTATVLMQLVEEGVLALDDPLSRHLPDLAARLPFGNRLTLRNLARHRSGVFSYTDDAPDGAPGILASGMADPAALRRGYSPDELIDFVVDHGRPDFPPDTDGAWAYSNTGYILLGMVIEKREGRPLDEVFRTRIFRPLGMTATYLWNDRPSPDLGLPRAWLSAPFEIETTDWNLSQGWAAGAVISTASDMHIFIQALLAGRLFRSAATLAQMQETVPTTLGDLPQYGIGLGRKASGFWGHGGQTLGFVSDVGALPDRGVSVIGWANSSQNAMAAAVALVSDTLSGAGVLRDPLPGHEEDRQQGEASSTADTATATTPRECRDCANRRANPD